MRLIAREEDIYKLMDQRDRCFLSAGLCIIAAGACAYILIKKPVYWDLIYFSIVFGISSILCLYSALKKCRKIMGTESCYLEFDGESLAVCQPGQDGNYESCRIFYDEMEKIVEGSRKGIPEFYVVIAPGEGKESFILINEEEQMKKIFCVRSLGYEREKFREFYKKLCWEVPGKVRVFGTKYQTVWEEKKSHWGFQLILAMVLAYIILKLFLAYEGF